jgi:hypothetical protein
VKKAPGWDGPAGARHYPHRSGARPSDLLPATRRIRGILPTIMWRSANRVSIQRITPLTCGIRPNPTRTTCALTSTGSPSSCTAPAVWWCPLTAAGPASADADHARRRPGRRPPGGPGRANGTVRFITDEGQMHQESLPGSRRAPSRGAPQAHSPRTCGPRSVADGRRWSRPRQHHGARAGVGPMAALTNPIFLRRA